MSSEVTMEDIKGLLERDALATKRLEEKMGERDQADVVVKDEIAKLRTELAEVKADRQAAEAEFKSQIEKANKLAEEAALKSGRLSGDDGGDNLAKEHKEAFVAFMRNPEDYAAKSALKEIEKKAVDTQTGAAGAFAVPKIISTDINRRAEDLAILRELVKVVTVGTTDYRELVDKRGIGYGWVGETDARAETGTPTLYEAVPTQGTIYAYPRATEESLDDMFFDVQGWLAESAGRAFATGKDIAIASGNGTDKPTGFLAGTPVTTADGSRADQVLQYVASGAAATFGSDPHGNLLSLLFSLKAAHRANATFVMNSLTASTLLGVKDADGRPIWVSNWTEGGSDMLLGRPVRISEAMPDIAANAFPVAVGDWAMGYTFVERHGLRMTRDDVTTPGYIKWHMRERVGGCVTNDEAIKLLKMEA